MNLINKLRSKSMEIIIVLAILLVGISEIYSTIYIHKGLEAVRINNELNQGLAVYMPGASCMIKATPDIDAFKFTDLAHACVMKHKEYLDTLVTIEEIIEEK